jgi:hypothetical protein
LPQSASCRPPQGVWTGRLGPHGVDYWQVSDNSPISAAGMPRFDRAGECWSDWFATSLVGRCFGGGPHGLDFRRVGAGLFGR